MAGACYWTSARRASRPRVFVPAVWMNTATGPGGGIAAMNAHALVQISNLNAQSPTRVAANHSDRFGGAFTIEQGAQVLSEGSVIEENSASQGGGRSRCTPIRRP
jgi:hypothetical protein